MEAIMGLDRGPREDHHTDQAGQGSGGPLAASLPVWFRVEETRAGGRRRDQTEPLDTPKPIPPASRCANECVSLRALAAIFAPPWSFIRRPSLQRGPFMWQPNTYDSS